MDVTAMVGPTTGVGQVVRQVASRLPSYPDLDLTGIMISWRGRNQLSQVIPAGWKVQPVTMPARAAHLAWRHFDRPRLKGFDLVHGPNYVVPPADGAARLVSVHDLTAWRFPELVDHHSRTFPQHLAKAVADGASIHTGSDYVGREIEDELGIDPERINVVRYGLGPATRGDGARARASVGGPFVLAIGTIEPRKDYVSLVRAMAAIWPIFPDLRLVIAGPSAWGRAALDEAITELGVADKIHLPGYVSESVKADLLAGAEVVAYPSLYEGFGFPILEAMQVGVPVVSTTVGSIPEVAGRAAILVEPQDPSALAGALLSALEDDTLRARLADAGRQQAAGYSWDVTVDGLVDTYLRLTGRSVASSDAVA